MLKNNQSYKITIGKDSINQIERFADKICDQLFINDTYYGNILMSLTEMINLINSTNQEDTIYIYYNTDYKHLNLSFQPIDNKLIEIFNQEITLENIIDNDINRSVFLMNKLTDGLQFGQENELTLTFDISALHNEIYEDRSKKLGAYFKADQKQKVKDKNDFLQ